MKRILVFLGWCLAVFLQGGSGYLLGSLMSGKVSFPPMGVIPFPLSWWAGIFLGVFAFGVANLAARKQFKAQELPLRLALTAAGAFIPVVTTQMWSLIHFRTLPLSGFTGALLTLLIYADIHESITLGLISFYVPGWIKVGRKSVVS